MFNISYYNLSKGMKIIGCDLFYELLNISLFSIIYY